MTFFLSDPKEAPAPRGPDLPLTGVFRGIGAATSQMMRDTNANFLRQRQVRDETALAAEPAARRVGIERLNEWYQNNDAGYDHLRPAPATVDDFFAMHGSTASDIALKVAREAAASDPESWTDLDLTDEGIEARVTERRKAEDRDEAMVLNMMPRGRMLAELSGGMVGAMADVRQLPFLFAGGGPGGSFLNFVGRQAFWGGAAEAVTLPSQFDVARELDKADPNPVEQIALGAAAGAVLGGAMEGMARGLRYWQGRNAVPADVPDPIIAEAGITAAEDAIVAGDDPLKAVADIMRGQEVPAVQERVREPLIPDDVQPAPAGQNPAILDGQNPAISDPVPPTNQADSPAALPGSVTPAPTALAPDSITTTPLANGADTPADRGRAIRPDLEGELAGAMENLRIAQGADSKDKRPLASWLKSTAPPNAAQVRSAVKKGKQPRTAGEDLRIDPNGALGQELKNQDITPKTAPGLFKKGGRTDLDNLVASEMEERFPGIIEATGTAYGDDYLNAQGIADLLIRENAGDSSWLRSRADVLDAERVVAEIEGRIDRSYMDEVTQYRAMEPADDGFFVQRGTDYEAVAAGFDAYVTQRGLTLLPYERTEIIDQLHGYGGEAKDLVERALTRDVDEADLAELSVGSREDGGGKDQPFIPRTAEEIAADRQAGEDGGFAGEPEASPGNAAEPGAGAGQLSGPAVEQTQAGSQYLAPGVAPLTSQDRLAPRANARMGEGAQRERDSQIGGLFDPNDKVRTDMFSDPADPKARPAQEAMIEGLRDSVARDGDFTVDLMDGQGERSASAMIRELDEDADFSDILDLCGKRSKE